MSTDREFIEQVAENVRAAMAPGQHQIVALASVIGVNRTTAGKRYRGQQEFTPSDLQHIADWLGYDPGDFFSSDFVIKKPAALAA